MSPLFGEADAHGGRSVTYERDDDYAQIAMHARIIHAITRARLHLLPSQDLTHTYSKIEYLDCYITYTLAIYLKWCSSRRVVRGMWKVLLSIRQLGAPGQV